MKLKCKEKIGLACVAGTIALMVTIPLCCCCIKSPEKRFLSGGKEMLGAIPDMAKKCGMRLAKKMVL